MFAGWAGSCDPYSNGRTRCSKRVCGDVVCVVGCFHRSASLPVSRASASICVHSKKAKTSLVLVHCIVGLVCRHLDVALGLVPLRQSGRRCHVGGVKLGCDGIGLGGLKRETTAYDSCFSFSYVAHRTDYFFVVMELNFKHQHPGEHDGNLP